MLRSSLLENAIETVYEIREIQSLVCAHPPWSSRPPLSLLQGNYLRSGPIEKAFCKDYINVEVCTYLVQYHHLQEKRISAELVSLMIFDADFRAERRDIVHTNKQKKKKAKGRKKM